MSSTANQPSKLHMSPDAAWPTVLETASIEVFEMMAGVNLSPVSFPIQQPEGDITAMVGLAGALCAIISIRCSLPVASTLASLMLGSEAPSERSAVSDALGELCNMVAGNFKAKFKELEDSCLLSLPTVIMGQDYNLQMLHSSQMIQIVFDHEGSSILISLAVQN